MKYFTYSIILFWSFISFAETHAELVNPETNGKIKVYLPNISDNHKVPVILIPPAGSRLFHGMELSEGDSAEHEPYVKAGFAVISFELSGAWPVIETDQSIYDAIDIYVSRRGGIEDAKDALSLAKKKFNNIDFDKVFVAGHSSAGTVALMIAQQLPNIKAVIAYAPIVDTENFLSEINNMVGKLIPDFKNALIDSSPHKNIHKYKVPIFLFRAQDDILLEDQIMSYKLYTDSLIKSGKKLTYKQVESGGHYQSMVDQGIPAVITWLKSLSPNKIKTK